MFAFTIYINHLAKYFFQSAYSTKGDVMRAYTNNCPNLLLEFNTVMNKLIFNLNIVIKSKFGTLPKSWGYKIN